VSALPGSEQFPVLSTLQSVVYLAGGSTTNLLKHLRKKHPEEARKCLENSKHSTLYRTLHGSRGESSSGGNKPQGPKQGTKEEWDTAVKALVKTSSRPETKDKARAIWNYTIFCAVDLHSCSLCDDEGFRKYHSGEDPVTRSAFETAAADERRKLAERIGKSIRAQREFITEGPLCSLQLDMWDDSGCGSTYAVATATYVTPAFEFKRVGLDVQAFPRESLTAAGVQEWVERFTAEYFGSSSPADVYVACTVGEGRHLPEAVSRLQVPVLACCDRLVNNTVMSGLTPSGPPTAKMGVSELVKRVQEMAGYLVQPSRHHPELAALQEAMGPDMMALVKSAPSPYSFLQLSLALLRVRPLLVKHYNNTSSGHALGSPRPRALSDAEWNKLCEAVGVFEACAEVDRNIRSGHVASLTETLMLIRELREYMEEPTLFLPDLQQDTDAHRTEKRADQLDSGMWHVRRTISDSLAEQDLGNPLSRCERLASVLDPLHMDSLLSQEQREQAWDELQEEYQGIACASSRPEGGRDDSGCEDAEDTNVGSSPMTRSPTSGKRKWQGALSLRKEQRRRQTEANTTQTQQSAAEVEGYKAMIRLVPPAEQGQDLFEWWLQRSAAATPESTGRSGASGSGVTGDSRPAGLSVPQLPVLAQVAARYHSIDASSIQAGLLLGGMGHRVKGLEQDMHPNSIENMLFLRLNKNLIAAPAF